MITQLPGNSNGMMYTSMVYIWYNCALQQYLISQLLEWEYQPIKLITPAIQKVNDHFFCDMCDFVIWSNATFKNWTDIHAKYTQEQGKYMYLIKKCW
jgi:hypothetical protein